MMKEFLKFIMAYSQHILSSIIVKYTNFNRRNLVPRIRTPTSKFPVGRAVQCNASSMSLHPAPTRNLF